NYKLLIQKVPKYMLILTVPLTAGIILLAPEIMYILGGEIFSNASAVLAIISISIIFSSLSTFLQQQILIPSGNEKLGLIASIVSSIVNLIANLLLIPKYNYIGAGIALVLAEFSAVLTRYIFTKKIGYDFVEFFNKSTMKYTVSAFAMVIPTYF